MFAPQVGFEEHQKSEQIRMTKYWEENGCTFVPNGLGFGENCKDFYQNYQELNVGGHVFLKIDIEGAEYDYFIQTDISNFENSVMGMSIEVHWFNDPGVNEKLVQILKKIEKYFILCHIHGNNWGAAWDFEGYPIPLAVELGFINKKFVDKYEPDEQDYPIEGLDVPNRPGEPDLQLTFLKYK